MEKLTQKQIAEAKVNPIFDGLPDSLKDPKIYGKIERAVVRVMFSDHQHKTIKQFVRCERCQAKVKRRRAVIKEFGFRDIIQYQEWKRVMDIIIQKKSLMFDERN